MKCKELKQLLEQIPDEMIIGIELCKRNGELIYGIIDTVDSDNGTIVSVQETISFDDIVEK